MRAKAPLSTPAIRRVLKWQAIVTVAIAAVERQVEERHRGSVRRVAPLGIAGQRPDLVVRFGRGPTLPRSLRRPVEPVVVRGLRVAAEECG